MSTQIEQQETETEADEETEPEVQSPGDRRRAQRDERQAEEQAQREVEEETLDDDDTITLSFGGPWGITYADLTPEEAHAVATALEDAVTTAHQEGSADE